MYLISSAHAGYVIVQLCCVRFSAPRLHSNMIFQRLSSSTWEMVQEPRVSTTIVFSPNGEDERPEVYESVR